MNKHLNNWLDQTEGLPKETTNRNIRKEMAYQLGKQGGTKSVQSRFRGKSKEQISEMMRRVRLSKADKQTIKTVITEEGA